MKITPLRDLGVTARSAFADEELSFDLARRMSSPIWVFDIDASRILYANEAACRIWQAPDEAALRSRDLAADMSPSVAKRLKQYQSDFNSSDATFTEMWTIFPNGVQISLMVVFHGFILEDGRMAMLCETVGEAEEQPENLRSAEALLHTDVMIALFSQKGPRLYSNPAARSIFVSSDLEFRDLFVQQTDHEHMMEKVDGLGEHRMVCRLDTASGRRWFDLSVKRCSDAATSDPALLVTAIDVSDLKEARDTAKHLADRDQLTNLYNRSYLNNHLAWLEETGLSENASIIFFDVDRFKQINDQFGHDAGDTVLKQIASRMRAALRPEDMLARLGGDEFIVVVQDQTNRAALEAQIERLRAVVAKPILHGAIRIDATISVGVATYTAESTQSTDVLREADIALYRSKETGRDRITFFDAEMGHEVRERRALEVELKEALATSQFRLDYQPRVDLAKGTVIGVEGLVRWHHPTRGVVQPGVFIPICEETGMINRLGRFVLEAGCAQAKDWHDQGLDLIVSLNVSPRQFVDEHFLATLTRLAEQEDFPRDRIELEITETDLIGDRDHIAQRLRAITAMGYRVAIDDFGTGYSNLSYISDFPLTSLKIDRSFISQLPDAGPIVQLIITLGQKIGADVVSEGVETPEQLDWLRQHGCVEAQGFFFSRPIPADQIADFVSTFALP